MSIRTTLLLPLTGVLWTVLFLLRSLVVSYTIFMSRCSTASSVSLAMSSILFLLSLLQLFFASFIIYAVNTCCGQLLVSCLCDFHLGFQLTSLFHACPSVFSHPLLSFSFDITEDFLSGGRVHRLDLALLPFLLRLYLFSSSHHLIHCTGQRTCWALHL